MKTFERLKLKFNNVFHRLFNNSNVDIICISKPDNLKTNVVRSKRVDMQLPANPVSPLAALLLAIGYKAGLAIKPIVYVLSFSKAILIAGATTAVIRPGIPWRAFREIEKSLARVIGYRDLTLIADDEVARAMSSFLLHRLFNLVNNPVAIAIFLAVFGAIGINGLKNWIEFLVEVLKRGGEQKDSYELTKAKDSQLFISEGPYLIEENRKLRSKVKQLERMRRFRGGISEQMNYDSDSPD